MQTILVIEDEAQTREIFLQSLRFEGFQAIAAENGSTGLRLAQTHLPDLIVCDIMMPDLNGYEVLTTLRQHPTTAAIPLIFLTAKVTMSELRQGMVLGADDYLTKPCTVEQFLSAIAARLARQESFKRRYQSFESNEIQHCDSSEATATIAPLIFPNCPKLKSAFEFIEQHYLNAISLKDVAQAAGYSPAYLTNLMQTLTGRSVKQWITERRMMQARSLLLNSAQSVSQISEAVGYSDVCYFIRQFRQVHGMSPQAWRKAPTCPAAATLSQQAV